MWYKCMNEAQIFDESVVSVEAGGFAFQRLTFSMKAHVRGEPNTSIDVELRKTISRFQNRR